MTDDPRPMTRRDLLAPSAMAGAILTYVEFLPLIRDPNWAGLTALQWLGMGLGFVLYFALVALLSSAGFIPTIVRRLSARLQLMYVFNLVAFCAAALCIGVTGFRNEADYPAAWVLVIVFAVVFNITFELIRASDLRPPTICIVWIGALASATVVLLAADSMLTTYPQRISNATRASLMWLAVALIFGHAFAFLTRRWRAPLIAYAVMTLIPLGLATLIPSLRMVRVDPVGPPVIVITHTDGKPGDALDIHMLLTSSSSLATTPPSMAKVLQAQGYNTAAFIALAPEAIPQSAIGDFELVQKFDPNKTERAGIFAGLPRLHSAVRKFAPQVAPVVPLDASRRAKRAALRYLGEHGSSSFFLWVNLNGEDPWVNRSGKDEAWEPLRNDIRDHGLEGKALVTFVPVGHNAMLRTLVTGPGTENLQPRMHGSLLDAAPSLVALTGGTPPPEWQGETLVKKPVPTPSDEKNTQSP